MKTYLILILLLALNIYAFGQNEIIDSLRIELQTEKNDTDRVNIRYDLVVALTNIGYFEESNQHIDTILENSKAIGYNIGYLKAKLSRANILIFTTKNAEAKKVLEELLAESENDISDTVKQSLLISIYTAMGSIYENEAQLSEALKYHTKALKTAKKLGIKPNEAVILNNISNIYVTTHDYQKAIEFQEEAIAIKKEINATPFSLGLSYFNLGQIYDNIKDYQKAIEYYNLSKKYATEANDAVGIGLCYLNTGKSYISLSDIEKEQNQNNESLLNAKQLLKKALEYEKKAVKILEENHSALYLPHAYNAMGTVLGNLEQYESSMQYYLKVYEMAKGKDISLQRTAVEGMYEVSKLRKNYKDALKWHEEFLILKDSISALNNEKEIGKKQAELAFIKEQEIADLKHQTEIAALNHQSEKERLIANNEKRKQQYIIWSVTIGLILVATFLFVIFRRWKITQQQKELIAQQKELIEKEKQATEDSINYARNIQKAAFPPLEEVNALFPNNFIFFKPKDIVSGDFYWATQHNGVKLIAIADCTGHGVPGAFMTLISLNILNQIIADEITNPKDILQELHTRLQKRLNTKSNSNLKHGLDIGICKLEENKLTYSGVHIPLYHVRLGNLIEYKGQKFQLGSNASTEFIQEEILLQKEDIFYLSTDGFPDQKGGEKGKKYYYPRFRKYLLSISKLNLKEQRLQLDKEFLSWKNNREQLDDVSVIGFKI